MNTIILLLVGFVALSALSVTFELLMKCTPVEAFFNRVIKHLES